MSFLNLQLFLFISIKKNFFFLLSCHKIQSFILSRPNVLVLDTTTKPSSESPIQSRPPVDKKNKIICRLSYFFFFWPDAALAICT